MVPLHPQGLSAVPQGCSSAPTVPASTQADFAMAGLTALNPGTTRATVVS